MVALTPTLIDRIRSNRFIWSVRFLQGIFAIAILGICASNATTWADIGCSTPSKLAYHIAASIITLFPVVFFILTSGPLSYTSWWTFWAQITLDSVFIIFWIAAAAVADYTCDDICSACSGSDVISFYCSCGYNLDYSGLKSRGSELIQKRRSSLGSTAEKATDIAAKQGLDGSMIFLLFVTLLTAIYLRLGWSEKKAQETAINDAEAMTENVGTGIDIGNSLAGNNNNNNDNSNININNDSNHNDNDISHNGHNNSHNGHGNNHNARNNDHNGNNDNDNDNDNNNGNNAASNTAI